MIALLFTVVFGLGIGYFATQNTTPVTLQLGDALFEGVPLYVVIVGSLLIGLLIAWVFYVARTVSSAVTIYGKEHGLKKSREAVADLKQRVTELEAENARLKMDTATKPDLSIAPSRAYSR
jgi:uncharacterized integral membrane protein